VKLISKNNGNYGDARMNKKEVSEGKEVPELYIRHVAKGAKCCRQTVINYEKRGFIAPVRDRQGFRRYTIGQALKLK
jgi:hypothetical protein